MPLAQLLLSLVSVGFFAWEHVLIVIGGAHSEEPPHHEPLESLLGSTASLATSLAASTSVASPAATSPTSDDLAAPPISSTGKPRLASGPTTGLAVAVIRTRRHASDYHGLGALYTHARHALVAARGYLYALDTCLAHPSFPSRFAAVAAAFSSSECSGVLYTVALPNSNLAAFGRGVVLAYQNHFSHLKMRTKREGIAIELGEAPFHQRSLVAFATKVVLARKRREDCGWYDTFRTGAARRC